MIFQTWNFIFFIWNKTTKFTRITKLKKKKNYWKNYISNLNKQTSLWSVARNLRNRDYTSPIVLEYSDNWIDQFASKICPDFVPQSINFKTKQSISYFPELCSPFSIDEFNLALSITNNTAPGIDNIKFIVLSFFLLHFFYKMLFH